MCILTEFVCFITIDPGAIDEQPHWYWLQDNSGGLASLPLASNSDQPNGKAGTY